MFSLARFTNGVSSTANGMARSELITIFDPSHTPEVSWQIYYVMSKEMEQKACFTLAYQTWSIYGSHTLSVLFLSSEQEESKKLLFIMVH